MRRARRPLLRARRPSRGRRRRPPRLHPRSASSLRARSAKTSRRPANSRRFDARYRRPATARERAAARVAPPARSGWRHPGDPRPLAPRAAERGDHLRIAPARADADAAVSDTLAASSSTSTPTARRSGSKAASWPRASASDVEAHRDQYQRSLVRRKRLAFEVRRDGRRCAVLLAPQIRDDELDEQIAAYLKSTQEWEPADGPAGGTSGTFCSKKRRAALFISTRSTRTLQREQTLRHHLHRHELDAAASSRRCARAFPHVELARSVGTRHRRGTRRAAASSATSRCSARSTRSRSISAIVRGHYVRLFAVATSALRRAENGEEFAQRSSKPCSAFRCACSRAKKKRRPPIAERSRHSARCAANASALSIPAAAARNTPSARDRRPSNVVSCEVGAVRLTEAVPELAGRDGAVEATRGRARARDRAQGARTDHRFSAGRATRIRRRNRDHDGRRSCEGAARQFPILRCHARGSCRDARPAARHELEERKRGRRDEAAARRHPSRRNHRARRRDGDPRPPRSRRDDGRSVGSSAGARRCRQDNAESHTRVRRPRGCRT